MCIIMNCQWTYDLGYYNSVSCFSLFSPDCGGEVSVVRFSPGSNSKIDFTVGDIETINCTATNAEPDSRVALFHNGTRVPRNSTLTNYDGETCIHGISLLLNATMKSDAGNYTCVFTWGSIQHSSSVSVTVLPESMCCMSNWYMYVVAMHSPCSIMRSYLQCSYDFLNVVV